MIDFFINGQPVQAEDNQTVMQAALAADQLTPPECSAEIAALVPGAEHHLLPDSGHMLTMEQPEVVTGLLVQWLGRNGWI